MIYQITRIQYNNLYRLHCWGCSLYSWDLLAHRFFVNWRRIYLSTPGRCYFQIVCNWDLIPHYRRTNFLEDKSFIPIGIRCSMCGNFRSKSCRFCTGGWPAGRSCHHQNKISLNIPNTFHLDQRIYTQGSLRCLQCCWGDRKPRMCIKFPLSFYSWLSLFIWIILTAYFALISRFYQKVNQIMNRMKED